MKSWYIRNNDEHLGPYSTDELRMLGLYSDDYVWQEGMPQWTKACFIPELTEMLITVEHVIFPKDEIQHTESEEDTCPSLKKLNKISTLGKKMFASFFK